MMIDSQTAFYIIYGFAGLMAIYGLIAAHVSPKHWDRNKKKQNSEL